MGEKNLHLKIQKGLLSTDSKQLRDKDMAHNSGLALRTSVYQ